MTKRRFIFRGKCEGFWVLGDGIFQISEDYVSILQRIGHGNAGGMKSYMVDPVTVGQFTGLHDAHGFPIFEDDIVRVKDSTYVVRFGRHEIDWSYQEYAADPAYGFYAEQINPKDKWRDPPNYTLPEAFENCNGGQNQGKMLGVIVGNIYDNPEMLQGGNS